VLQIGGLTRKAMVSSSISVNYGRLNQHII
jgi:hypothetical protein